MFFTVNHFQMFKPGSGTHGALQIQTENQSKASEQHQTLLNRLEMREDDTVHIKDMQSNKINIIQHTA